MKRQLPAEKEKESLIRQEIFAKFKYDRDLPKKPKVKIDPLTSSLVKFIRADQIEEATDLLNKCKVDVDCIVLGTTALHLCAELGYLDLLKMMLPKSKKPISKILNSSDHTIAHTAAIYGQAECLKFILDNYYQGLNPAQIKNSHNFTLLTAAIGQAKINIISLLVNDYGLEILKGSAENMFNFCGRAKYVEFINQIKDPIKRNYLASLVGLEIVDDHRRSPVVLYGSISPAFDMPPPYPQPLLPVFKPIPPVNELAQALKTINTQKAEISWLKQIIDKRDQEIEQLKAMLQKEKSKPLSPLSTWLESLAEMSNSPEGKGKGLC